MSKNYYFFLCLFVCIIFSSCDDDEKETIPPVVTITAPDASKKLNGSVTISANATDDSGIVSVAISVDGTLLHESIESEVSHNWNTETVSDGSHTIEVVATDAVGNTASAHLTVEVFNDKKAPLLTLVSPVIQPFVKSTVKIDGSVTDDSALESIKIYVDNALLTTLNNTSTFSFDWDTKGVADGNHMIKVSATDDQGNEASVTREVKVFNYFFTINIVDAKVPSHVTIWYLISKPDGTLIGAKPYVQGDTKLRFETPDNYNANDRYVFTAFNHTAKFEQFPVQTFLSVETGVRPGEKTVMLNYSYTSFPSSELLGYHTLNVNNLTEYNGIYIRGVNMYSRAFSNNTLKLDLGYYNTNALNPYVSLLASTDAPPRFKNFTNLQLGGSTNVTFDDFQPMVGNKITADGATYTYGNVWGVEASKYNETNLVWNYSLFGQQQKAHYLYYPQGLYPEFIFTAQEVRPNENDFFLQVGSEAPTSVLKCNAAVNSFTKQNRTLTLSTSGTYDVAAVSGSSSENVNGETTTRFWSVQFNEGNNHTVTLPQLPAALAAYNFPDLASITFSNASFTDYSGFSSYDEIANFTMANPGVSIYSVSKTLLSKSVALPTTGGRLKGDAFDQTYKIMLENNKRMRLNPFYTK